MVQGYDKLSDSDKRLFDAFCENYRKANWPELVIEYVAVRRDRKGGYLRVDLLRDGRATWQQVFSSTTWG